MNMTVERADNVSIKINDKLSHLHHASSKHTIFRVYDHLRKENEDAYEPQIISIGPYHHDKPKLKPMEQHKLWYLQQLLEETNERNVDRYVSFMRGLEERARECYADPIGVDSDEFVEMMLLDSCFVIEFFRKFIGCVPRRIDDPVFKFNYIYQTIKRDLRLLENQLPFFILVQFFNMTLDNSPHDLIGMALRVFEIPAYILTPIEIDMLNIKHLLGLIHHCWCSSFIETVNKSPSEWNYIKSTSELKEAGIQFKSANIDGMSLFHISFTKGVMEVPLLEVYDGTEAEVRNLIAYEQYLPHKNQKVVTDYFIFLNCLINIPKDVEILRHRGVVKNGLGDDSVLSTMFNKLGNNVSISDNFSYSDVFNKVNKHCGRQRNVWMANLRHTYFNTPWAFISFLAAFVLLLLTVTNTSVAILSFVGHKP